MQYTLKLTKSNVWNMITFYSCSTSITTKYLSYTCVKTYFIVQSWRFYGFSMISMSKALKKKVFSQRKLYKNEFRMLSRTLPFSVKKRVLCEIWQHTWLQRRNTIKTNISFSCSLIEEIFVAAIRYAWQNPKNKKEIFLWIFHYISNAV